MQKKIIIIIIINERKTNKGRKEQGEQTEAIVKGWELNDFVVRLS